VIGKLQVAQSCDFLQET